MKCDNCIHKEVCGKKEAYKETYDKLNKDTGEFEVDLKCSHYSETYKNYNDLLRQQSGGTYTGNPRCVRTEIT
jgi:hypothetical protein